MKQYFLYQCRFEAMSDDFPAESAKKSRRISLILKRRQLALASAEAKRIAVEGGWKRDKFMRWTTLNFGKHVGKSLPQIILSDADWFFWAYGRDVFKGRLSIEAEDLASKATRIKIPKSDPENWQVEYRHEDDGRFIEIAIVEAEEPSVPQLSRGTPFAVPRPGVHTAQQDLRQARLPKFARRFSSPVFRRRQTPDEGPLRSVFQQTTKTRGLS